MIEGQVIAVTGASSGIGRAAALALARIGAKLVLGARHEEALVQVAANPSRRRRSGISSDGREQA